MESPQKDLTAHINRIIGQLETLKKYIQDKKKDCHDVTNLTISASRSFDTLRSKILENYLKECIPEDSKKAFNKIDINLLRSLIKG